MSSPVIGYAALQVIPSMRGVHELIRRELAAAGQSAGANAGEVAGRSMGASLQRSLASAGETAYRALEAGAAAAGVGIGASLAKGYSRLTTIQDATSALTISLGDSAAAGDLLADVLDVVQGTPFKLDQFAFAAQRMKGMGIEAEKIPTYLTAIGEASATQGKRAGEFADRLSYIWGQVAAQGQLQLHDVWRISDTGVNALAILSNAFGVTRDEMKDMISAGAVPAGRALDALADGILNGSDGPAGATTALAGTMEALRENMSGAVAGIDPAMARLGEALLVPFSPAITAGANAVSDSLGLVAGSASDLLDDVADSKAMEGFIDLMEDAPDRIEGLLDRLGEVGPLAGAAGGGLAAMATGGLSRLLGPLGMIVPQLGPIPGLLLGMVAASPAARSELAALASDLAPLVGELGDELQPVIMAVAEALEEVLPAGVDAAGAALVALLMAGTDVIEVLGPLTVGLLDVASPALIAGLELVGDVLEDHGDLLVVVAAGWLAVKAGAQGAAAWSAVSGGIGATTAALGSMREAIAAVAATRGVSQATAALGILRSSITEAATASVSGAAIAGGALAAIAIGGTLAYTSLQRSADNAAEANERYLESIDFDPETLSISKLNEDMQALQERHVALLEEAGRSDWTQIGQDLSPWNENTITEAQRGAEEIESLMEAQHERVMELVEVADRLGTTTPTLEAWAKALDIELDPDSQTADQMVDQIATAMRTLAEEAGIAAPALDEALGELDPTVLKEQADALDEVGEAASDAWSEALDLIGAFSGKQFGYQVADGVAGLRAEMEANLAGIRGSISETASEIESGLGGEFTGIGSGLNDRLEEIDESLADTLADVERDVARARATMEGDELANALSRAAERRGVAIADAERDRAKAAEDAEERRAGAAEDAETRRAEATEDGQGRINEALADGEQAIADYRRENEVTTTAIEDWYSEQLWNASAFSANLTTALEQGYDPGLLARMLEAGPTEAGPTLEALVQGHSDRLVQMVNDSEESIRNITDYAAQAARLTYLATTSTTSELADLLPDALEVASVLSQLGGEATNTEIASMLDGISSDRVREIAEQFQIVGVSIEEMGPAFDPAVTALGGLSADLTGLVASDPTVVAQLDSSVVTDKVGVIEDLLEEYAATNPEARAFLDSTSADEKTWILTAWLNEWETRHAEALVDLKLGAGLRDFLESSGGYASPDAVDRADRAVPSGRSGRMGAEVWVDEGMGDKKLAVETFGDDPPGGTLVVEVPVVLDGKEIGRSRAVIDGVSEGLGDRVRRP